MTDQRSTPGQNSMKARRADALASLRCVELCGRDAIAGGKRCEECLAKRRRQTNERRNTAIAAGLCVNIPCQTHVEKPGSLCRECSDKLNKYQRDKRAAEKLRRQNIEHIRNRFGIPDAAKTARKAKRNGGDSRP